MKKIVLFITGFFLVIAGMTLLLGNWEAVAIVFKGIIPMGVAVGGLVMMFAASLKQ